MAPRDAVSPVFEHADFWLFNKPAGTSFHSENGASGFFVQLQQSYPNETLYPVHRLDKITSGLVIAARSSAAAKQFQQLFAERKIRKTYLALSDHKPLKKQGWIRGDMEKSRNGNWKLSRNQNHPAITQFHTCALAPRLRLFVLQPHTGRTHQVRVAMKSLASPILGDTRYGGSAADRGYLHACQLSFDWENQQQQYRLLPDFGDLFLQHQTTIEQSLCAL